MSYTNQTANYGLPQYTADDKPTYLGDFNKAMLDIDTAIKANENIARASETLAQNANNSASEALSTANTASSSATNAGVKADNAYALAESAKADATQATTDATDAKTIANSANQTATSANATATSAQTTANAAKSTSDNNASAISHLQTSVNQLQNDNKIDLIEPTELFDFNNVTFKFSHLHKQGNHYFGQVDAELNSGSLNTDGVLLGNIKINLAGNLNTACFTGSEYNVPSNGSLFINASTKGVTVYGTGNYIKFFIDLVAEQ